MKGPVTWIFSGEPIYSPVSSRVLGECNAITSPGFDRNGLTFVSTPVHHFTVCNISLRTTTLNHPNQQGRRSLAPRNSVSR